MKHKTLAVLALLAVVSTSVVVAAQQTTSRQKPSAGRIALENGRTTEASSPQVRAVTEPATPAAAPSTAIAPAAAAPAAAAPAAPAVAPAKQETPGADLNEKTAGSAASMDGVLPVGTTLRMKLETPLSTSSSRKGDMFSGRLMESVSLGGRTVIPVGASVEGRVTHVSESRRFRGVPSINIMPETVIMPSGERMNINAVVVDTNLTNDIDVDEEGRMKGVGHSGRDIRDLGIFTGGGAIVGALIAHTAKGTLIGAGVGATVEAVRFLARKHSEDIPAGTEIFMELSRPVTLGTGGSGR
ncbi:MAG TPA: hypothetical protein VFA60_04065 [Terriglobales bacterium]|nr:hypothetical protein [Terriglobales bacterium]